MSGSTPSLSSVLIVQAQNAFNDNFVKLVLVGLAVTVAQGTVVGDNIEFILAALIPIPFILMAPIAGWLSDRYAKSKIIYLSLIAQLLIFVLIVGALFVRSVELAIFGYFLLAVQSTIFSPAKQGILKELVGSKGLGSANGLLQMLTMVGILAGMALGGGWFDTRLKAINAAGEIDIANAWPAAIVPVIAIGASCIIPLLLALIIRETPSHPEKKFHGTVFFSHFSDVAYVFQHEILRRTSLFIAFYWLVANFVALAFFGFAKELYPDVAEGGVSGASGRMFLILGGGLIVGSLIVAFITRGGNKLFLTIFGSMGMTASMIGIGTFTPETIPWFACIAAVGLSSGFFIVPLSAHLQDRIDEDHRGRVLSAVGLMAAVSGILAICVSIVMKKIGLSISSQVLIFATPVFVIGLLIAAIRKSKLEFPIGETVES